jgi:hypothetical protein
LQLLSTKDGAENIVTRVVIAPDRSIWLLSSERLGAARRILCRYDGPVGPLRPRAGLGPHHRRLHVDADGTVWVGAGGNTLVTGVWRLEGNQFTQLDASAGLSDLRVGAIQRAARGCGSFL